MCTVSLTVVSRPRTCSSPFSSVLALSSTVKSTPISSYLKHKQDNHGPLGRHENDQRLCFC